MSHLNGDVGCNIGELSGVIMWPTQIGGILGAALVNWVGYLSG